MNNHPHSLVAIVTLLSLLVYFWMSFRVAQARAKYGIAAPAVTGNDDFERVVRAHYNTLEWMPIFLPALWLFALLWNADLVASGIGVVWIVGRVMYAVGYAKAAQSRSLGFLVQSLACIFLVFGALIRAVMLGLQFNWT
jgi:uncharacterized membrane protein YecN with MAPEG domain